MPPYFQAVASRSFISSFNQQSQLNEIYFTKKRENFLKIKTQNLGLSLERVLAYSLLVMGIAAVLFQITKAATTGFWWDEAWIADVVKSYMTGHGWQKSYTFPWEPFRGHFFDSGVSTGPTVLMPALFFSLLMQQISPPLLHLFIFSHVIFIWFALIKIRAASAARALFLWIILATLTPEINMTQFLGEFPAACWLVLGVSCLATAGIHCNRIEALVAGAVLGCAVLTKLVFLLAVIPVFLAACLLNRQKPKMLLMLGCGIFLPFIIWHLYQLIHVGNLETYLTVQKQFTDRIFNSQNGAGIGQLKSLTIIKDDFLKFISMGPAFVASAVFVALGPFIWFYREKIGNLFDWLLYLWVASCSGIFWWVLASNFRGEGALPRHAVGFVCLALTAVCVIISQVMSKKTVLQRAIPPLLSFFLIMVPVLFLSILFTRGRDYVVGQKGYGPYSAWILQKELSSWIDEHGSLSKRLPIINCDPSVSHNLFISHVELPQRVLSSGFFESKKCAADIVESTSDGPAVILNRSSARFLPDSALILLAGHPEGQGLWQLRYQDRKV